jgi:very-short-patch-repair endonuclease
LRFIEEPSNLINVAITRAREGLFIVGNYEFLKTRDSILGELIRYSMQIEELRKPTQGYMPSQEELILFSLMVIQGWNLKVHHKINHVNYEVDFLIESNISKTVVEVDGLQHKQQTEIDNERDQNLQNLGYNIYRTSTRKVRETPSIVIKEIAEKTGLEANIL